MPGIPPSISASLPQIRPWTIRVMTSICLSEWGLRSGLRTWPPSHFWPSSSALSVVRRFSNSTLWNTRGIWHRTPAWHDWLRVAGITTVDPTTGKRFETFYFLLQAAASGLGVAIGPYPLVADDLARG